MSYIYTKRSSNYGPQYNKVTVVRSTKTVMVVKADHAQAQERTFTLRSGGYWMEKGETGACYRSTELEFDVAAVEKILADRAAHLAKRREADELRDALEKAVRGQWNGFGDFAGSDVMLARMRAALDVLTGADDVH